MTLVPTQPDRKDRFAGYLGPVAWKTDDLQSAFVVRFAWPANCTVLCELSPPAYFAAGRQHGRSPACTWAGVKSQAWQNSMTFASGCTFRTIMQELLAGWSCAQQLQEKPLRSRTFGPL